MTWKEFKALEKYDIERVQNTGVLSSIKTPQKENKLTSIYFLALSHAPPVLDAEIAICLTKQRRQPFK